MVHSGQFFNSLDLYNKDTIKQLLTTKSINILIIKLINRYNTALLMIATLKHYDV